MFVELARKNQDPVFHGMRDAWRNKEFCDVQLSTGGDASDCIINAHRLVLGACSSVLKKRFLDQPDPRAVIIIKYVEHNALLQVIRLIYEGSIRIREEELEGFFLAARYLCIRTGDPEADAQIMDGALAHREVESQRAAIRPTVQSKLTKVVETPKRAFKADPGTTSQAAPTAAANSSRSSQSSLDASLDEGAAASSSLLHTKATFQGPDQPRPGRPAPNAAPPTGGSSNERHFDRRELKSFKVSARTDSSGRNVVSQQPPPEAIMGHRTPESLFPHPPERLAQSEFGLSHPRSGLAGEEPRPPKQPGLKAIPNPNDSSYWLELINVVDSGEHAIRDKFKPYGMRQMVGEFGQGRHLYVSLDSEAQANEALRTFQKIEPGICLRPVKGPPTHLEAPTPLSSNASFDYCSRPNPGPIRSAGAKWDSLRLQVGAHAEPTSVARLLRHNGFLKYCKPNCVFVRNGFATIAMERIDLERAVKKFAAKVVNGVPLQPQILSRSGPSSHLSRPY